MSYVPPSARHPVYLTPLEFNDFMVARAAALPGGQSLGPYMTQRMRETLKKTEFVPEHLVWTDANGTMRREDTWRTASIRSLPRHQPELEAANHGEGKGQTALIRTKVRTRLGDIMAPEKYRGQDRAYFALGQRGVANPSSNSIYAGIKEAMRPMEQKDRERNVRDGSTGVHTFPYKESMKFPMMSRPTRV